MSHRDLAAVLFAAWTVAAATGLSWVLRSFLRGRQAGSGAVLVTGMALLCGAYAAIGWAWFLATGGFR